MEGSPLLNRHRRKLVKTQNLTRQAEEAGSETSEGHSKGTNMHATRGIRAHEDEQSWHFWFWVGYIFVELPARRVLMAYYDLKHPKFTHWSMYFRLVMVRSILSDLKRLVESSLTENEENAKFVDSHMGRLAYPMKSYRPYRRTKGDTSEEQTDQKDPRQSSYGDATSHYSGK
ncbi:hypothetical protein CFRS1_v013062 [Colletotrichum fructicola]|nr:hypothetical protein CFRS1_v013062 [Colletotrichum fructicola]